jgi:superfamily II DNA or RNA helicase
MLREEQIDLRRRRAAEEHFKITNLGRNRVFSDFQVSNPASGGQYRVSIRGFDVGDNACECPDFKTNTLGTCKHIEAVLAVLRDSTPPTVRRRKADIKEPEVHLHYGEQLRPMLLLPPRHSDQLRRLATAFFDEQGMWKAGQRYQELIESVDSVPERVTIFSDAMDFMMGEVERLEMAERERGWLAELESGHTPETLRELLTVPLYPYQLRGAVFLACRGRCILGDDMGLGKTTQTLAAAEVLARQRGVERVLVVAPASVKYQWETEIRKFTGRTVQVVDGLTAQRRALYRTPTFYRLVNYELVGRDLDELNAWQPDLIVLDEAQRLKNWEAKTTREVKKLRSRYAFVLTGTPLENKLEELYSIVRFVDDRRLGPAFQFLHDHRILDENGQLKGYRNLDRIREKLAPILLRRTRAEVLSQLPARTDTTIYVEMADAQRGPYGEQQHTLALLLQKKYLNEVDRRRILSCLANLRMLCDSLWLLDRQSDVSPKLDEFAELLTDLLHEGERKVVVFSQWEMMLRKAAEVVERLGIGHALLCGSVPGKERRGLLERFHEDTNCRIFLSTDAGGTGLNLQTADTVINLELPWNPAVLEQRIARVHRLGQHRPVQVFHFVTRDSIEERVLKVIERKRELFAGVFEGVTDEVAFEAVGNQSFMETVRSLVEDVPPPEPVPSPVKPTEVGEDATAKAVEAGVCFLEALAAACGSAPEANGQGPVNPLARFVKDVEGRKVLQVPLPSEEVLRRGTAALRTLLQALGGTGTSAERQQ